MLPEFEAAPDEPPAGDESSKPAPNFAIHALHAVVGFRVSVAISLVVVLFLFVSSLVIARFDVTYFVLSCIQRISMELLVVAWIGGGKGSGFIKEKCIAHWPIEICVNAALGYHWDYAPDYWTMLWMSFFAMWLGMSTIWFVRAKETRGPLFKKILSNAATSFSASVLGGR